jgi:acyl-coenzyme A thioesterase PaaI-like protein
MDMTGLEFLRAICDGMTTCDRETAYTTTQLGIYLTGAIDASTGPVRVEGRVVHRGRRIVTAAGTLTDEHGRLLAHGTTSCLLMPRRRAT